MNLLEALSARNLEYVKDNLTRDPVSGEAVDEQGIPVAFLAVRTGDLSILQYIVEYSRASMNTVDALNRNILHYASESGNTELATYLVEKVGMSITSPDNNLVTPFDIAHDHNHEELLDYFEQQCGATLEAMYRNPIRTGMFPDPSIVRVGEDYYMVNSSFVYFPCIPISHSRDLIHWKIIGHAITTAKWANLDTLEGGRGYWAPDISYHKGRFYITATYRMNDTGPIYRRQIVVSSEKPEGPYSEPAWIEEDGIDPSLFTDDDGKRYMLLNRGARILELSEDGTRQISEAKLLFYGDQKRAPEGPHLLRKDGYYYLFLAEGGTGPGHRITVARAKTLFGNYEPCPYNPIMRQMDERGAISRCGHGKPVMTHKGEWFMVYLCGRMMGDGYTVLGRETALDPITWTQDGWPLVNKLKGPSALQIKPNLTDHQWENHDSDDFDEPALDKEWMFPRPPEKDGYALHDGCLWIKGSKEPMHSIKAKNIVVRRQKHFAFTTVTKMILINMTKNQEAGMTCYYDENSWIKFGIFSQSSGKNQIKVVERIGELQREGTTCAQMDASQKVLYLRIKTHYFEREFSYSYDGIHYETLLTLDNVNYLSDEGIKIGKRFTGAMVGMYAYADRDELVVPFDSFHYEPS